MIQVICPHCGNELQIPAKYAGQSGTCTKCGNAITVPAFFLSDSTHTERVPPPRPSGMSVQRVAGIVAVAVGIVFALVLVAGNKIPGPGKGATSQKTLLQIVLPLSQSTSQKVQAQTPGYTVSANQLYSEYDSNEVAADAKYKGKTILVSGTIESIGKDILGDAYIVLEGGGFLSGVQCMFAREQESSVARLSKGQQVRVKGKVKGKFMNVLVDACSLQ